MTSTVLAGAIWIGLIVLEGAGLALAARNDLPDRNFYTTLAIAFAAIAAVGVLIVSRHPRNLIGWLFLATMVDIGTLIFFEQYSLYGLETRPGSVPGTLWTAWAANWMWVAGILPFMAFVPLLFPTGRLPSPRWRPLAWVAAGLGLVASIAYAFGPTIEGPSGRPIDNPLGVDALAGGAALVDGPGGIAFAVVILLSLSSLVTRFRHAGDEIDLDALTAHLLDVVDETMEPARISLWLKGRELSGEPVR